MQPGCLTIVLRSGWLDAEFVCKVCWSTESSHGDMAEGKVDSIGTGERVDTFAQGCDSMVDEAGRASPYGDVAVFYSDSAGSVGAGERTEQEGGG